ncbi:MAG TPA: hypothetical protein VEH84_14805 [Alphaproteobacteria bacterium]|nr:hypothetical protein [Alphaproteobacteria bacterium]
MATALEAWLEAREALAKADPASRAARAEQLSRAGRALFRSSQFGDVVFVAGAIKDQGASLDMLRPVLESP